MNPRAWMLGAYSILLRLYPESFRERFGEEMLQVAGAAEPAEWPFIFGDTGVAIARCWIEGTHSTVPTAPEDAYVPLGGTSVRASGLLPGLVLSVLVVAGLFYASFGGPSPCQSSATAAHVSVTAPSAIANNRLRN
ncbi:MAG TPA: hypothetical protein VJO35_09760 [Terriglobales bacterium]|nr:hypothetical protein [Terriglobales bacterium]